MIYISSSLVTSESLAQPLTHARIGWLNIITSSGLTGTDGLSGFPLSSILNPATYERYKPNASTATINYDNGTPVSADYLGLQSLGVSSVTIQASDDGVNYSTLSAATGVDDCSMFLFEQETHRYWRIILTGSNMQVVALKLGVALAMQRAIYAGHSPITLAPKSAVRPTMSEKGQFLGSSVQRLGLSTTFEWKNLKATWYRDNFDPFVQNIPKANPFFIAWRPASFPSEVAYAWASNDIVPSNTGVIDMMQVSMQVEGFVDGSQ